MKKNRNDTVFGRREVIGGCAGAAGLFLLGALATSQKPAEGTLVRPPGSRGEKEFLALCLRCDRCRSACHTGVIGVAGLSDGVIEMRTPVMNFRRGFCDFCRRCAQVCPTGAIEDFDPEAEKVGLAEITQYCIALRTAACTKCHDECPYDAISLDNENRPMIDPEICNGCGKCEEVCPASIYQAFRGQSVRGVMVKPLAEKEEDAR